VLQGRVSELRAVRDSVLATAVEQGPADSADQTLISNTVLQDFRMIVAATAPGAGGIGLSAAQLELLHCRHGDQVRALPLNVRKHTNG
jgi:arginine N-succinyltransferase